ncbi:hypothetical protein GDO78_017609 [Eleutherodactylus coqui]|uniref:Uncharacterized protein n=1 Tax=Eleutherodactylus coqui TaxID=57060 RepID=A0A8J6C7S8_ELECQ|nr:hypothetical protein GDO78_017609 [Eleutherodactylus coqui]
MASFSVPPHQSPSDADTDNSLVNRTVSTSVGQLKVIRCIKLPGRQRGVCCVILDLLTTTPLMEKWSKDNYVEDKYCNTH